MKLKDELAQVKTDLKQLTIELHKTRYSCASAFAHLSENDSYRQSCWYQLADKAKEDWRLANED